MIPKLLGNARNILHTRLQKTTKVARSSYAVYSHYSNSLRTKLLFSSTTNQQSTRDLTNYLYCSSEHFNP